MTGHLPPYPLTWPEHLPRTKHRGSSQFKTNLNKAMENVKTALRRFGSDSKKPVRNVVVSSNVTLGASKPKDPGVAIWFEWDGLEVCIAVDRYATVQDNVQAIYHIIEARRTELRHGGLNIVRATFTGFVALPSNNEHWSAVLGVREDSSAEDINQAYRRKAQSAHPDHGGSSDAMQRLNAARDAALREVA